jgi:hypothetical protein
MAPTIRASPHDCFCARQVRRYAFPRPVARHSGRTARGGAARRAAADLQPRPVQPRRWRDFYFRIADEAPVDAVYFGEVVCSKRAPLTEAHLQDAAERLRAADKQVVLSTLPSPAWRDRAADRDIPA